MLPHGLEPWTSRLLAERSNQLSYESKWDIRDALDINEQQKETKTPEQVRVAT